jgi:hypothetical protein
MNVNYYNVYSVIRVQLPHGQLTCKATCWWTGRIVLRCRMNTYAGCTYTTRFGWWWCFNGCGQSAVSFMGVACGCGLCTWCQPIGAYAQQDRVLLNLATGHPHQSASRSIVMVVLPNKGWFTLQFCCKDSVKVFEALFPIILKGCCSQVSPLYSIPTPHAGITVIVAHITVCTKCKPFT